MHRHGKIEFCDIAFLDHTVRTRAAINAEQAHSDCCLRPVNQGIKAGIYPADDIFCAWAFAFASRNSNENENQNDEITCFQSCLYSTFLR